MWEKSFLIQNSIVIHAICNLHPRPSRFTRSAAFFTWFPLFYLFTRTHKLCQYYLSTSRVYRFVSHISHCRFQRVLLPFRMVFPVSLTRIPICFISSIRECKNRTKYRVSYIAILTRRSNQFARNKKFESTIKIFNRPWISFKDKNVDSLHIPHFIQNFCEKSNYENY